MIRHLKKGKPAETKAEIDEEMLAESERICSEHVQVMTRDPDWFLQRMTDEASMAIGEVCSRLCALEHFSGHKEQADIRVRRLGSASGNKVA